MSVEKIMTQTEIEERIKELSEEEIAFVINVNNIIGHLGPKHFQSTINAISKSLFILQKEDIARNIINITVIANKILQSQYKLNRAEAICILYYLQQNIGTIHMDMETNEMPTWSIRDDIFKKLSSY